MSARPRELRITFLADDEAAAQVLRVVEIILSACAASIWNVPDDVAREGSSEAEGTDRA